jgi:hypothetical protein
LAGWIEVGEIVEAGPTQYGGFGAGGNCRESTGASVLLRDVSLLKVWLG